MRETCVPLVLRALPLSYLRSGASDGLRMVLLRRNIADKFHHYADPPIMAKLKATFNDASVETYIASRANAQQEADCRALMKLFSRITKQKTPRMWGPSIVGFGSYTYTNSSRKPAEVPLACFAIRGKDLVVYLYANEPKQKALLAKVGKYKMGKSCFYFRQLADLDTSVLEKLVLGSIAEFRNIHKPLPG